MCCRWWVSSVCQKCQICPAKHLCQKWHSSGVKVRISFRFSLSVSLLLHFIYIESTKIFLPSFLHRLFTFSLLSITSLVTFSLPRAYDQLRVPDPAQQTSGSFLQWPDAVPGVSLHPLQLYLRHSQPSRPDKLQVSVILSAVFIKRACPKHWSHKLRDIELFGLQYAP